MNPAAPYKARPPFLNWPKQWVFDWGLMWLTPHGDALLTQLHASRITPAIVDSYQDQLDALAVRGVRQMMPNLRVLHDWRAISEIDPGARETWARRTRRVDGYFRDVDVYIAIDANPLVKMALRSATLTIQLAIGQRMAHFVDNLSDAMARHDVRPPPADFFERFKAGDAQAGYSR